MVREPEHKVEVAKPCKGIRRTEWWQEGEVGGRTVGVRRSTPCRFNCQGSDARHLQW